MKLMRQISIVCVAFLLAYGPFYRYLRGLVQLHLITVLPYAVMGATLVLACMTFPRWRRQRTTPIDDAIWHFLLLISITFLCALAFHSTENALKILRAYILPLGVFFVTRDFSPERINWLIRFASVLSLLSVLLLFFEFFQINIFGVDPRQSIVAVAYTRAEDFDPRQYQAYFAQEAWKLPLIGYIVRPFGVLGAPQISGIYYVFMFWVVYFLVGPKESYVRRLCLSFFLAGTLLTDSRTAMIGLITITILVVFRNMRGYTRVPVVLVIAGAFMAIMYPSFEALLDPERRVGILNSGVFLKDLLVFLNLEFEAIRKLNLLDLLFGTPKIDQVEAFEANGIISAEYYFTHLTDVGILGVIVEIGLLPTLAIMRVFFVSHKTFLAGRTLSGQLKHARGTFIFAIWMMLVIGSIHYLAITVYCMNVIIMLVLAYIARESQKESPVKASGNIEMPPKDVYGKDIPSRS